MARLSTSQISVEEILGLVNSVDSRFNLFGLDYKTVVSFANASDGERKERGF